MLAAMARNGAPLALGLATLGSGLLFLLFRSLIMLREANEKIAALAAAQERDRLARDLHDLLGHSLTTITVKLGPARRLIETGAERDHELAEIRDAERLSRQALAEIRATLSGYRRAFLAAELAGARMALTAAGISPLLPQAVDEVPDALREPFAHVVREGVTNVIRHSGGNRCEIRLGPSWLEVRDDGASAVDIAAALHLSYGTVRNHLSAAIGKTGARTRAEARRIAEDHGRL